VGTSTVELGKDRVDEDLREILIHCGATRLRNYSWEAAARATVDVYRSVV
jgi:hypothetical protein